MKHGKAFGRERVGGMDVDAERSDAALENRECRRSRVHHERVGAVAHLYARGDEAVQCDERIVLPSVDLQVLWLRRDGTWRRLHVPVRHLLERPGERLEDPVEPHAHLERERPAGVVIGRRRRRAGIRNHVRMVLPLEHVQDVRTERLRGEHDE